MAKITLNTLLNEFKKLNRKMAGMDSRMAGMDSRMAGMDSRMGGLEAKVDDHFHFLKDQIQTNQAETRAEFTKVHGQLKIIRDQTAHVTVRVATLEQFHK